MAGWMGKCRAPVISAVGMLTMGLAVAMFAVVGPALSTPVLAAEREFETILALGAIVPLATDEGLDSTIVLVDHESEGHFGEGTLIVKLDTVELTMGMRHALTDAVGVGYRYVGVAITEGFGEDLYRDGERLKSETFTGNSQALVGALLFFPKSHWRIELEAEGREANFTATEFTRDDFVLPAPYRLTENRLLLIGEDIGWREKGKVQFTLSGGRRGNWRPWSLDGDADAHRSYQRWSGVVEQIVDLREWHAIIGKLSGLGGRDLDLFSSHYVGGFAGKNTVAGFFRNEFRARQGWVLNVEHKISFAKDRVLSIFGDWARLNLADLSYLQGGRDSVSVGGLGIGYFHGFRGLMGMPVIVRYGEGLAVPEGSRESHRREVLLAVAIGF